MAQKLKSERVGDEKYNNQGCLMKIVQYNRASDIVVEFQDEYKAKIHAQYGTYKLGNIKNPYAKTIYGKGMMGEKYPSQINYKRTREFAAWRNILKRSFDKKFKNEHPTYENVTCCDEWLLFDNFYEWLHEQPNFSMWHDNSNWSVDKDILIKKNKIYSSQTCCLVPQNVNVLFTKRTLDRGECPIGVSKDRRTGKYIAQCENPLLSHRMPYLGTYNTPTDAFNAYKKYKENVIKQVANIEFDSGNITEACYNAMMNYKVEITD